MAKRVKNRFGLVSEVPDDYPENLMRQLELEEVQGEEETEEHEPQPQREGRRRR
jgi:hypothetical protein